MRQILFRGKRKSDGKWIFGMYDNEECGADFDCIIPERGTEEHLSADWAVIPETVGQFTGLTDKNGVKIFEGDIVQDECENSALVMWDNGSASFFVDYGFGYDLQEIRGTEEVIGNVHDNPELR